MPLLHQLQTMSRQAQYLRYVVSHTWLWLSLSLSPGLWCQPDSQWLWLLLKRGPVHLYRAVLALLSQKRHSLLLLLLLALMSALTLHLHICPGHYVAYELHHPCLALDSLLRKRRSVLGLAPHKFCMWHNTNTDLSTHNPREGIR